jgi:hypothetical protein
VLGSQPHIVTPPPPPTLDDARLKAEQADLVRQRQGAAATYVSTPAGRAGGGVASKMLLGQGG